jgi:hypothetical protein
VRVGREAARALLLAEPRDFLGVGLLVLLGILAKNKAAVRRKRGEHVGCARSRVGDALGVGGSSRQSADNRAAKMKTRLKAGGQPRRPRGPIALRSPAKNASVGLTVLLLPEELGVESVCRASNPSQNRQGD